MKWPRLPMAWFRRRQTPPPWTIRQENNRTVFTGKFFVDDRAWRRPLQVEGSIVEWPGLPAEVYLLDPPAALRRHPHGPCLQLLRPNSQWFKLHWSKPPRTFLTSKEYVENMLWEAEVMATSTPRTGPSLR